MQPDCSHIKINPQVTGIIKMAGKRIAVFIDKVQNIISFSNRNRNCAGVCKNTREASDRAYICFLRVFQKININALGIEVKRITFSARSRRSINKKRVMRRNRNSFSKSGGTEKKDYKQTKELFHDGASYSS